MGLLIALVSLALASSANALLPRGDIGTVCKAPVWLVLRDFKTSTNKLDHSKVLVSAAAP